MKRGRLSRVALVFALALSRGVVVASDAGPTAAARAAAVPSLPASAAAVVRTGAFGAAPASLPDVDSCVRVLDPQLDIGYDRIAARCPVLARELEHGAWSSWLPRTGGPAW